MNEKGPGPSLFCPEPWVQMPDIRFDVSHIIK